jgi:hypothetical protein
VDSEEKEIQNKIANEDLKIRQFKSKILDNQVSIMLIKFAKETITLSLEGKTVDTDRWARKLVAHVREQI